MSAVRTWAQLSQRQMYAGYSRDKRKMRRQHRKAARYLRKEHGGSIIAGVTRWHLNQARYLGR